MEKVNRCFLVFFFFTFIYLFIMFCCYQYSWLSILLMGSITVVCFMCRVRIFNDTCNILLYIILEVLMTSKCNFVTCNILFHLVLMIGQIYYIELNGYESGFKKKNPELSYYASIVIGHLTFVKRILLLICVYEFNVMNLKCR